MVELKKTKFRQVAYSKVVVALMGVLVVFVANGTWQVYKRAHELAIENGEAESTLTDLQDQKADVTQSLDALQTSEGVERSLREKFGVVKPGEEEVVLVGNSASSSSDSTPGASGGFWAGVAHFFGF